MKFRTYLVVVLAVLAAVVTALAIDPMADRAVASVGVAVLAVITLADWRTPRPAKETSQR